MGSKSKHPDQAAFIGGKVNYLFENIKAPSGREYTAEAVQAQTGIHASYIRRLRNGKISNPGHDVLAGLTDFFGIEPQYWFQPRNILPNIEAAEVINHVAMIHRQIAEADLKPHQSRFLARMVEQVLATVKSLPDGTKDQE